MFLFLLSIFPYLLQFRYLCLQFQQRQVWHVTELFFFWVRLQCNIRPQ